MNGFSKSPLSDNAMIGPTGNGPILAVEESLDKDSVLLTPDSSKSVTLNEMISDSYSLGRRYWKLSALILLAVVGSFILLSSRINNSENKEKIGGVPSAFNLNNVAKQTDPGALHINLDTIIEKGKDLQVTGRIFIQNVSDSSEALQIRSADGNDVLVVDTKTGRVGIGAAPTGNSTLQVAGDITASGTLQASNGASSLSNNGLIINSVLVCTADGCLSRNQAPAQNLPDTADIALLSASQVFTGNNRFNGGFLAQNSSNSTTAFQIQNAAGTSNLLIANTVNNRLAVNQASANYTLDVAGDINTTTGFRVGGSAGTSLTCPASELLQQATISGGIITSGSCVAIAGGATPSFQEVYNASTPASFVLNGTNNGLFIRDALTPLATNLFEVKNNSGATVYFAVNGVGISITGNVNTTGQYQVGGTQISSANLSNDANLAKLNGTQTFTGNNTFSSATNSFTGNGSGLTSLNATNVSSGTLADARLSSNVALLSATQTFAGNNTFSSAVTTPSITTSGAALGIGAASATLNLSGNLSSNLAVTNGTNTIRVGFSGIPVGNVNYNFDNTVAAGTYNICTTIGNCAGSGGGVTTPGGTANTLAKFTAGQTIGNSIITDNGTTVTVGGALSVNTISPTGALTIGTSSQTLTLQGGASTSLSATSVGITNSLVFAAPATSNKTITIPNATGTVAVSASGPIALDTAGNLTCSTCLTSGGGNPGVSSINTQTGAITLQGTTNQVGVSTVGTTITLSTPQDIHSGATPTFANTNVTGQYQVGGTQISSANLSNDANLAKLNGTQTFTGNNTFSSATNSFTGNGSGLTSLNATNVSSGTLADARLSSNVPLKNAANAFTNTNSIAVTNAAAFQVQNAAAADTLFTADTTARSVSGGNLVKIGNSTGTDTNTTLLVVDGATANPTSNLSALNGGLFYNSTTNKLSVIENATVKVLCNTTDLGCGNAPTTTLAQAYSNGAGAADSTISLDATRAGVVIRDNATPLGADLFTVQNNGGTNKYLNVTSAGIAVAGNVDISGQYRVGGTQISSANLSNDANLAKLNGTQTFTGNNTFSSATNSITAFQVQNSAGIQLFNVDTTVDAANLITNGSLEIDASGWAARGASTVTRSTTDKYLGLASLSTATTAAANDGAKYNVALASTTQYTLSLSAKLNSGTFATFQIGRSEDGTADTSCLTAQTVTTTGWTRFTCTFTTGTTSGTTYIYAKQTDATARTFYLDAIKLEAAATATPYREGIVSLGGVLNQPVTFKNQSDSTTAFQVQNASSNEILTVNTTGNSVVLGKAAALNGTLVFNNSANANAITIQPAGSQTANYTLQLPALSAGTYSICTDSGNCSGAGATLQTSYNNSSTPEITVDGTRGALTIQDNATPIAANLFEVQSNGGVTKYLAVDVNGISVAGNTNVTGQYQVGGTQISSANLSNDANLAKLNGTQTFTGNNTFSSATNSFTGNGSGLTSLNATNVSSGTLADARLSSNVPLKNAANAFTNTNSIAVTNAAAFQVQNSVGGALLTVDTTNTKLAVGGDIVASAAATATTATTSGTGTNTTTVTLTAAAFANGDVVLIDNVGQDYYTRITAGGGTASLTVSPAVTFETTRTVTKYTIQNIGAKTTDYATLTDRFFQGYFLGGVVTGAGSTTLSDGRLHSTNALNLNASSYVVQNTADSATALQIMRSGSGGTVLTIDTSTIAGSRNGIISVGASDTTATLLVLDTKTDVGDPTGVDGAMYYNSNAGKFRCYQAGVWADCVSAAGAALTLQDVYNNDTAGAPADIVTTSATKTLLFKAGTGFDSTSLFQIQNAAGTQLLVADSTNSRIYVGNPTGDTIGSTLVLDTKTDVGDPTGVNGAMYYNSNAGKFRCYQAGAWTDCVSAGGASLTLQDVYNNDTAGTPADIVTTSATKTLLFKAGTGFDSTSLFQIQNAAGINLFNADTSGSKIAVNQGQFNVVGFGIPATPSIAAGSNQGGSLSGATGTTYYYKVTALNAAGESLPSAEGSIAASSFTALTAPGAPTVAINVAAGNLNGAYTYKITFVTANGETTGGTTSASVSPVSQQVDLSAIPIGPTGTTQRKIYRTAAAGADGTQKLVTTIADNTTTIYTDNLADASLGAALPGTNTARTNLNNATVTFTPITGATSYRIYRSTTSGSAYAYQTATASPFTDTGAAGTSANPPSSSSVERVGIGTATPSANLHVAGDVLFKNTADSVAAFQVQNSAGGSLLKVDSSGSNITLFGNNNGALGTAQSASNLLPGVRTHNTSVAANGYLYVIGGEDSTGTTVNTVYYAKLNGDGSVGTWATTSVLPANRRQHSSVVSNGYVYVFGGRDGVTANSAAVYYAKLNPDGTLGTWQTEATNPLPATRRYTSATAANGFVYITGGWTTAAETNVWYSKVNANGSLGAWTQEVTNVLPQTRYNHASVVANGYLYVLGGVWAGVGGAADFVRYSALNPTTGAPGAWSAGASGPVTGLESPGGVTTNGYVYVLGGDGTRHIRYAKLNSDGTTGSWSTQSNILAAEKGHFGSGAVVNGYVYLPGGGGLSGTPRSDTTYYLSTPRVQIGANLDLVGVQNPNLNGGDEGNSGNLGGSITAGNGFFTGGLQVQGAVNFAQNVSIMGNLNISSSSGTLLLAANSASSTITLGTASSTPVLLVLGTKNTLGHPTCTSGAIYYNSSGGSLSRAYVCENSVWKSISNPTDAVRVTRTSGSGDQIIANNTATNIAFDDETFTFNGYDTNNFHDNVTNNQRLTVPVSGKYEVFANITFAANATGYRRVSIMYGGIGDMIAEEIVHSNSGTQTTSINLKTTLDLSTGDYVYVEVQQTSGGNLNVRRTVLNSPIFGMTRLQF